MIRFFPVLAIIAFILILWGCEQQQANIIYDESYIDEIKQTREDIALHISRNKIPGATIAIAKEDKLIYSEGIGLASKEMDVPMTRENKTRIGDVSQIFTFIIYLKLVEDGILIPDSTVQYYLPDYPATDYKLELKHLPYHTSGIRKEEPGESEIPGLNYSIQRGLKFFMNEPLTAPPGWFEESSMFNANLLGAVMEKATNKKFPVLLKEYVTDTLKLTNTLVDDPFTIISGRSDFYHHNMIGQIINAPFRDMRYKAPSKGILSNAEDLVKLGMAILESDYFNEEFTTNLFKPCELNSGYKSMKANGWVITTDNLGRDVNGSSGSVTGGGGTILIYPEEKLVVAFTVNLTIGNDIMPVSQIASYFLDEQNSE